LIRLVQSTSLLTKPERVIEQVIFDMLNIKIDIEDQDKNKNIKIKKEYKNKKKNIKIDIEDKDQVDRRKWPPGGTLIVGNGPPGVH